MEQQIPIGVANKPQRYKNMLDEKIMKSVFNRFDHDFISVKGKSEREVRQYINDTLYDKGIKDIKIDEYVNIFEVNGDTIIKR